MDFDGDGRLDLLSSSNCCDTAAFHLFRRKADGSWVPRQRLELTPREKVGILVPTFVSAADYNGDGVPDLLCRSSVGKGIVVALGPFKEGGPVAVSQEIDFTPKPADLGDGGLWDFAVADWDRDGKADLLIQYSHLPGYRMRIFWHKNLGGPGLTKLAEGKLLLEIMPTRDMRIGGFCVADWSGTGWPGLMVTRQEQGRGSVWFYPRE